MSLIQYLPAALFIAGLALRLHLYSRDGSPAEATLFLRSAKDVVKNKGERRPDFSRAQDASKSAPVSAATATLASKAIKQTPSYAAA